MFTQKLYKNGNSVAVTIPKDYLKYLNLRDGSQVLVKQKGRNILISPKKVNKASGINARFMKMVDDFVEEHKDVLQELAKK